jgi:hypothetical protein
MKMVTGPLTFGGRGRGQTLIAAGSFDQHRRVFDKVQPWQAHLPKKRV